MTPELKTHIDTVVSTYYQEAKKEWDRHAFNRKPTDHVFKSILYLRDQLKVNRKFHGYSLPCAGEHEIHFLVNVMNDLKDSLRLSHDQLQWTRNLYQKILICCLKEHPRTKEQIELKEALNLNSALSISLDDGKQAILARIRNMLISQNI